MSDLLPIDRAAILYRPNEVGSNVDDPSYTEFDGLAVVYKDGTKPSEAELLAADESNLTTITAWHLYGERLGRDFLYVLSLIHI